MQSSSPVFTKEEQQRLLRPHEYTREALFKRHHQDCVSSGHRTEFTRIRCGYCCSCHWRRGQIEEIGLRDKLKDYYVSLSKAGDNNEQKRMLTQRQQIETNDLGQKKWGMLDVLGQLAEPICDCYGCHHKCLLHGSKECRCKHPTNKALGIEVRYL
jgi:hypothetical protein